MEFGEIVILAQDQQGGVMMNMWYDVQIKFVQRNLEVKWAIHQPANMPDEKTFGPLDDDMAVALTATDGFLASGTIAFGVNGADQGIGIARIQVVPLKCSDPNDKEVTIFIPHEASRYKETARNIFDLCYNALPAEPETGGKANWKFELKFKKKNGVVRQKTLTYGDDHIGTFATLQQGKTLLHGVFMASIYLEEEVTGWAGLVFALVESKNYHMIELGEECKITKVVNGKRKFIRKNPNCVLEPKTYYRVHLKVVDNTVRVLLGTNDEDVKVVLDWKGTLPTEAGQVGFLTYKQKAAFADIQLMPISDYQEPEGDIAFENEKPNTEEGEGDDLTDSVETPDDFKTGEDNAKEDGQGADGEGDTGADGKGDAGADGKGDAGADGQHSEAAGESEPTKEEKLAEISEAPKVDLEDTDPSPEDKKAEEIQDEQDEAEKKADEVLKDPTASKKEKDLAESEEIAAVESGICLTAVTVEARENYCGHKYLPHYHGAYVNCAGPNFCSVCCESETSDSEQNKSKVVSCKEACGENSNIQDPIETEKLKQCFTENDEQKIYEFCDAKPEAQIGLCKSDMCKMCCTTSSATFGVFMDDASILGCITSCDVIFTPGFEVPTDEELQKQAEEAEEPDNGQKEGDDDEEEGQKGEEEGQNGEQEGQKGEEEGQNGEEQGQNGEQEGENGEQEGDNSKEEGENGKQEGQNGEEAGGDNSGEGESGGNDNGNQGGNVDPDAGQKQEEPVIDCNVGFKECVLKEKCKWDIWKFKCIEGESWLEQQAVKVVKAVQENPVVVVEKAGDVVKKAKSFFGWKKKKANKLN